MIPFDHQIKEEIKPMKNKLFNLISKTSRLVAPFALVLAIMTANSTCYFFSYQPDVPKGLDKYRMK